MGLKMVCLDIFGLNGDLERGSAQYYIDLSCHSCLSSQVRAIPAAVGVAHAVGHSQRAAPR